jgi:hypothetical protein
MPFRVRETPTGQTSRENRVVSPSKAKVFAHVFRTDDDDDLIEAEKELRAPDREVGSGKPQETGSTREKHMDHAEAPVYSDAIPWPKLESTKMEGKSPGNAKTNPFGNGKGATEPKGSSTGAHDFIANPRSSASEAKGSDAQTEWMESQEQSEKPEQDGLPNKESVADDGIILKADAPGPRSPIGAPGSSAKSFKLRGE